MALKLKGVSCVLFVCLFGLGSAEYCIDYSDCTSLLDSCCSDNVCRESCSVWTGGSIAGAVVGAVVFIAITASIVACYFCACCPYYRYRSPGAVIVSQPGYQQFVNVSTTHTAVGTQQVQQYPPPGNYNQPPLPGYNQHPPAYPYPQPTAAQYPPLPVQGQTHMPPRIA